MEFVNHRDFSWRSSGIFLSRLGSLSSGLALFVNSFSFFSQLTWRSGFFYPSHQHFPPFDGIPIIRSAFDILLYTIARSLTGDFAIVHHPPRPCPSVHFLLIVNKLHFYRYLTYFPPQKKSTINVDLSVRYVRYGDFIFVRSSRFSILIRCFITPRFL